MREGMFALFIEGRIEYFLRSSEVHFHIDMTVRTLNETIVRIRHFRIDLHVDIDSHNICRVVDEHSE